MHELGIIIQLVRQMESYMKEHKLSKIESLVLRVGMLSGVVPKYIEDVYPIAVKDSLLEHTRLKLEIAPGVGKCKGCNLNYHLVENDNICPRCNSEDYEIVSGKEFMIQEIHAY